MLWRRPSVRLHDCSPAIFVHMNIQKTHISTLFDKQFLLCALMPWWQVGNLSDKGTPKKWPAFAVYLFLMYFINSLEFYVFFSMAFCSSVRAAEIAQGTILRNMQNMVLLWPVWAIAKQQGKVLHVGREALCHVNGIINTNEWEACTDDSERSHMAE